MARAFVEHLAAHRRAAHPGPGGPAELDWDDVWAPAEGAVSLERGVGRSVVAANDHLDELLDGADRRARRREAAARRERRARHLPSVFAWVRNIGAVILLFVAWQLWGTSLAEHHAQSDLAHQFRDKVAHAQGHAHPYLIPATVQVPPPAEGSVVAHIDIPAVGISQFVVNGTDADDLALGPGHYIGTAVPGQAGNVAIAGHRTTHGAPFNRLGFIVPGDRIQLETTWGQILTYVVTVPPFAVSPSDVAVLDDFGDDRLTLTTCNPEFSAAQRLIVVARLVLPHKAVPARTAPHRYHLKEAATASWRWALLPLVLLEVVGLVLLGLANRRLSAIYGRVGRWMILGPLWALGLFFLFSTLTAFVPPSI
jgi:sortase A